MKQFLTTTAVILTMSLGQPNGAEPFKLLTVPFDVDAARQGQKDCAAALKCDVETMNSVGMKLALIPPGRFTMGPNGSTYRVTIGKPFYLGVTEVTLGQFRNFKPGHKVEKAAAEFNEDDRPVAMVNWDEASEFCQWLSRQPEEVAAGRVYTLPSEAQWEWVARAGTATPRYFGETDKDQIEYSWFNHTYTPNPEHEQTGRGRQPVAQLKPNGWGLHDMLGYVWEWCGDRHTDDKTGELRDPVMRGGSWRSGAFHCTAVAHDPGAPQTRADNIGFRVACRIASTGERNEDK